MKTKRNDSCPCGRGRKYKKCCGSAGSHSASTPRSPNPISDENGFLRLISQIDDDLREQGFVIPDRPEEALRRVGQIVGCVLSSSVPPMNPSEGVYSGPDLAIRVLRWYKDHYNGALEPGLSIKTEAEFLSVMEEVDSALRAEETLIPSRPLRAMFEIGQRMKAEFSLMLPDRDPAPGVYSGQDLVLRVKRWYDARYGDRLLALSTAGDVVFSIRGDAWKFRLPLIYGGGRIRFVCEYGVSTTLSNVPRAVPRGIRLEPSVYNILDAIADLPESLARSLNPQERQEMLDAFMWGLGAYDALREIRSVGMAEFVRADLTATVTHLMTHQPQPGLAKWAAFQAAEKMLKTFIAERGGKYERNHKLSEFCASATALGLPPMDLRWISETDCKPGARYGEFTVSLGEAIKAHHASLRIVAHIARELK